MREGCVPKSVYDIERHAADASLLKLITFLKPGHVVLVSSYLRISTLPIKSQKKQNFC